MAELTLKDESVLEIGKSVSQSFEGLASTGKSMLVTPGGQPLGAKDVEADGEKSSNLLTEIRDSIRSLVDIFADSFSFQKKEAAEADIQERVGEAQATELGKETVDDGEGGGIFAGAMAKLGAIKEGAANLLSKDGFIGLLIKGGLIAGLMLLAKGLQKYGKQIAEAVAPIIDGVKAFFTRLSEDIGPLLSDAFSIISDTFSGIVNLVKGIFTLDGDLIKEGLDSLKTIPLRVATFLLDAVGTIINSIGAAFGLEGDVTTNIKNFFIDLKNTVVDKFNALLTFFTEDIPAKIDEMKEGIKSFFTETIDKIKSNVKGAFSSIGNFFSDMGDKVKGFVNSAIDALPLPKFLKDKLKLETKASKAASERITDTGIKAKYADESITGMQRERMTGGGATMGEGFAEFEGEKYGTANIRKSGTAGYDSASGIMTPEEFTEFNKLKTTDEQLDFLKQLDEKEQARRRTIEKLYNDQKTHNEKLAQMIKDGKALDPEFGGEIVGPDDALLQSDMAYAERQRQMREDSAAMANRDANKVNVVTTKGDTNNVNTANNTYTTILEDTKTSDGGIREALSA